MEALFFIAATAWLRSRCSLRQLRQPKAWDARWQGWHCSPLQLAQELLVPAEGLAAQGQPKHSFHKMNP